MEQKCKKDTFTVGDNYRVMKADGSTVEFKFIGGEPPRVLLHTGEKKELSDVTNCHIDIRRID